LAMLTPKALSMPKDQFWSDAQGTPHQVLQLPTFNGSIANRSNLTNGIRYV
jgi:hypothetical protein